MHNLEVAIVSVTLIVACLAFAGYVIWHLIKVLLVLTPYWRQEKATYNRSMRRYIRKIEQGKARATSLDPPDFNEDDF